MTSVFGWDHVLLSLDVLHTWVLPPTNPSTTSDRRYPHVKPTLLRRDTNRRNQNGRLTVIEGGQ